MGAKSLTVSLTSIHRFSTSLKGRATQSFSIILKDSTQTWGEMI